MRLVAAATPAAVNPAAAHAPPPDSDASVQVTSKSGRARRLVCMSGARRHAWTSSWATSRGKNRHRCQSVILCHTWLKIEEADLRNWRQKLQRPATMESQVR